MFVVLISVIGWFDPRNLVRPEGLCQWKILMIVSGLEHSTFRQKGLLVLSNSGLKEIRCNKWYFKWPWIKLLSEMCVFVLCCVVLCCTRVFVLLCYTRVCVLLCYTRVCVILCCTRVCVLLCYTRVCVMLCCTRLSNVFRKGTTPVPA